MAESGTPAADGTYRIVLRSDEGTAADVRVVLDSTPPVLTRRSPVTTTVARALVVAVSDKLAGVKSATLRVDGKVVRRLQRGTTTLVDRPPARWRRGKHKAIVAAVDRAGNKRVRSFTINVRS